MDHTSFMQSLQQRASQFLVWLIGSTQTRHQQWHQERQHHDGFLRSGDDPDAR